MVHILFVKYIFWNQGHPDNENQSDGRAETIDSTMSGLRQ